MARPQTKKILVTVKSKCPLPLPLVPIKHVIRNVVRDMLLPGETFTIKSVK